MKKIFFCLVVVCFLLSGCGKTVGLYDLTRTVKDNPTEYFGDYDDLEYISSEYIPEQDGYYILYQGKRKVHDIVNVSNLNAHFYKSKGEWILHDVEKEITSTYLDIAGTRWTTTDRLVEDGVVFGEDIRILDVKEDGSEIYMQHGSEKIRFEKHVSFHVSEPSYISVDSKSEILVRYYIDTDTRAVYLFLHINSHGSPDLIYSLAK